MSARTTGVTVIIATHQRRDLVLSTLDGLALQYSAAHAFDVVVSADSCTDGTVQALEARRGTWPMEVRVVEHTSANASVTRNLGAQQAHADWLIFIDDDIRPAQGFMAAHLAAQAEHRVVLGYAKPIRTMANDRWHFEVWRWWEDMFHRGMGTYGHRFTYTDFLSGNFAMSANLFRDTGGFDEGFTTAWEDHEFGLRLIRAGAELVYVPEAMGEHRFGMGLQSSLKRRRQEGRASVQFGRLHPELRSTLFGELTFGDPGRRTRAALWLAEHGTVADAVIDRLRSFAADESNLLAQRRLRAARLAWDIRYWQGVLDETGSRRGLAAWMADGPAVPAVSAWAPTLDVEDLRGIPGDTLVEFLAPGSDALGLRVVRRGQQLLSLRPDPGAEALRLRHVTSLTQSELRLRFVPRDVLNRYQHRVAP